MTEKEMISGSQVKKRESNIELLRIVCMLFLIAHHCVIHGGAYNMDAGLNKEISIFLIPIGKICFNAFLAVSAWFLIDKPFRTERFMKTWLQVLFYSIVFTIVTVKLGSVLTIRQWISTFFPIAGNSHGFAAAYLAFYLCIPFLHKTSQKLTQKQLQWLLILLFYFQVFSKGIAYVASYTQMLFSELQLFIMFYFLLLYLKKYPIVMLKKKWFSLIVFLSCWIIMWIIWRFQYFNPDNFWVGLLMSINEDESGIIYILGGCALMFFFKELRMPCIPIINKIAGTVFGVLLIHDHNFFRYTLWGNILKVQEWWYSSHFILHLIIVVFIIFVVCAIIDILRSYCIESTLLSAKFFKRLCNRFDSIINVNEN